MVLLVRANYMVKGLAIHQMQLYRDGGQLVIVWFFFIGCKMQSITAEKVKFSTGYMVISGFLSL
jgi:hypothetical protein